MTQSLAVDEKSKLLYFIASPNNATQRYLYKVRLDGKGKLEMVTPNELEGSHNYQISPKANFAFHQFFKLLHKTNESINSTSFT